MKFEISDQPIDANGLRACMSDSRAGAFITFEGRVRDNNEGKEVKELEYEAYKSMAEKEGVKVLEAAKHQFEVIDAHAVHRVGKLALGDIDVGGGVLRGHRDAAYQASRFIIDELKKNVPIWKKEIYTKEGVGWPFNEA